MISTSIIFRYFLQLEVDIGYVYQDIFWVPVEFHTVLIGPLWTYSTRDGGLTILRSVCWQNYLWICSRQLPLGYLNSYIILVLSTNVRQTRSALVVITYLHVCHIAFC